jgi:hypothetical protein
MNLNGQTVMTESMEVNNGSVKGVFSMENLSAGMYIVNMTSSNGVIATKKVMIH